MNVSLAFSALLSKASRHATTKPSPQSGRMSRTCATAARTAGLRPAGAAEGAEEEVAAAEEVAGRDEEEDEEPAELCGRRGNGRQPQGESRYEGLQNERRGGQHSQPLGSAARTEAPADGFSDGSIPKMLYMYVHVSLWESMAP